MQSKSEVSETLNAFIHEVGIPYELHSDNAKELMEGKSSSRKCVVTLESRPLIASRTVHGKTVPRQVYAN